MSSKVLNNINILAGSFNKNYKPFQIFDINIKYFIIQFQKKYYL